MFMVESFGFPGLRVEGLGGFKFWVLEYGVA